MKSDVCLLSKDMDSLKALLDETEKAALYSNLDKKQTLRLRLLAEELVGMLPELLDYTNGSFWIENDAKKFELHVTLSPNESLTAEKREKLLEVSSSGKNSAASGIMAKIKIAAQFMLIDYQENAVLNPTFFDCGLRDSTAFSTIAWSLNVYREKLNQEKKEDWDELEKSIIANIADDVCVGLQGKKVDIIVKKTF
jgi:hypothetical protein